MCAHSLSSTGPSQCSSADVMRVLHDVTCRITKSPWGTTSMLAQLCSGHIALHTFLKKIWAKDSALCSKCGALETVAHFLLFCCHDPFPELSPTQVSAPFPTGFTPVLPLCTPQAVLITPDHSQPGPRGLPCHIPGQGQNPSWNGRGTFPHHRG